MSSTQFRATVGRTDEPVPSSSASPCALNRNYHLYNLLVCQCRRRVLTKDMEDRKPCPVCLSSNPSSNNRQGAIPGNSNAEAAPELGVNNVTPSAGTSESMLNSAGLDIDASLGYENGSVPLDLIQSLRSALTPPVSHSGLTPPPTPDPNQYPKTPVSSLDGNTHEAAGEPGTSHLVAGVRSPSPPTCRGDGISDDENMSELQIDFEHEQEVVVSFQEPIPITHIWSDENSRPVDAWAILSSSDSDTIEKYVCPQCFCSHDRNSLPNHLRMKHGKDVSEIIALYMVTPNTDMETSSIYDSYTNI